MKQKEAKIFIARSEKKQNFKSKNVLKIIAVSYQSKMLMRADWLAINLNLRAERLYVPAGDIKPANAVATSIAVFSSFKLLPDLPAAGAVEGDNIGPQGQVQATSCARTRRKSRGKPRNHNEKISFSDRFKVTTSPPN